LLARVVREYWVKTHQLLVFRSLETQELGHKVLEMTEKALTIPDPVSSCENSTMQSLHLDIGY
jgi:hypothetical protein